MSDQQAYDLILEQVEAMDEDEAHRPVMPVSVFIHETLRLLDWAGEDREDLEGAGMQWALAEELSVLAAALRHAEGVWANERFISEEAQKQWTLESVEAYDLRDTLVHTFRFAFRRQPDLKQVVDQIALGDSHVDMLQDLKTLVLAGRRNEALLHEINFNMVQLARCESLTEELSRIYAEARNDRLSYRQAKLVRDKIFTLLKQSVDEVRAFGQYVFWRDSQRRTGYASEYHRRTSRPSETPDAPIEPLPDEPDPTEPPEPPPEP